MRLPEPDADGAETSFRRALDVARSRSARSLELRACASLSRLWAGRGKRPEARAILEASYGWFTERFGTRDLVEARGLLDELGG